MLNELVIVERGLRQAGVYMSLRHSDVKAAGKKPTLHVFLNAKGHVARVCVVESSRLEEQPLWKLVEGQKNSFPFVQPKPLWTNDAIRSWRQSLSKKASDVEKRQALLDLASDDGIRCIDLGEWTSEGMIKALRKRRQDFIALEHSDVAALPVTVDRFLLACDKSCDGNAAALVRDIAHMVVEELKRSASPNLLTVAIALFVESGSKGGAFYFDAEGNLPLSLTDNRVVEPLCQHLRQIDLERSERTGICSLTGEDGVLVTGNFSQPNLPIVQQSFLFARNEATPSASRYGKLSSASIQVGYMTDIRLCAAVEALCAGERRGKTWRAIPGEASNQRDLLLAFVEAIPDTPMAESLAEEDFSDEVSDALSNIHISVALFEKRTERMIQLVKAKVGSDVTRTPVQITVLRKVDPANRKIVYANALSVADFYHAATTWAAGERNVPPGLTLPVLIKGEPKPRPMRPPHVAPLGLIAFSKQLYIRGGTERQDVVGLSAAETMGLFLTPIKAARRRAEHVLRLVLARRTVLLAGVVHAQHTPGCWVRRSDVMKKFDCNEALRTITLVGILLHKLSREKEVYMNGTAFKLGQLLAAADVVHAGYCADVRGGAVPPSLLGNQVFAMAQTGPTKALATLCRRWKPYDGWAKKAAREPNRTEYLVVSNKKDEQQRGEDIKKALGYAREMGPLAAELAPMLDDCRVDDAFRAELLLGYIAGLPKAQKQDIDVQDLNQE